MLNFRFHLVSLVAVFLALAIGVVMGTTVIDRGLVDTLEGQQERLGGTNRDLRVENGELRADLEELRADSNELDERSARLVEGELFGVSALLIAVRGAESDGFDALRTTLVDAGADVRGTLWLTDRFALDDPDELSDLADALGQPDRTAEGSAPRLRRLAVERLAVRLRVGSGATGVPASNDPDLLTTLTERNFLDFDPSEGSTDDPVVTTTALDRLVLVAGPGAGVADAELAVPLASALAAPGTVRAVPLVAVEAFPGEAEGGEAGPPERAPFTRLVRDDAGLAEVVSTVDNIDEVFGRLAVVLTLSDLGDERVGHFGRGPGADALLPDRQ